MAGKGTYGAYVTQGTTPSREWAGASQAASMAAAQNQKRAEEREEQRKIRQQARDTIEGAIDASNLDLSKIESSVHLGVGKVLDDYAEKLTAKTEALKTDYSFTKQMELKKFQTEFQSKINTFTAIGEKMKYVSGKEWDNALSSGAVMGNAKFIANLPDYMEKMDPETLEVDGVHISKVYDNLVDISTLIDPVDSEGILSDVAAPLKEDAEKVSYYDDSDKVSYNQYTYNSAQVKQAFANGVRDTNAYKKIVATLLTNYQIGDNEDLLKYVTVEGDDVTVSDANVFNYFKDMFLPEKVALSKEELEEKEETSTERNNRLKALDAEEELKKRIEDVEHPFQNTKGTLPRGSQIKIGGSNFSVKETELGYDPVSGQQVMNVLYEKTDGATGTNIGVRQFSMGLDGMQEYGSQLFSDFDFARTIVKQEHNPSYKVLSPDERAVGLSNIAKVRSSNVMYAYSEVAGVVPQNHEEGIERMKAQLTEYGLSSPVMDNILNTNIKTRRLGRSGFLSKEGFATIEDQESKSTAITLGAMYAKSLLEDGVGADEVKEKTIAKIKKFIEEGGTSVDDFGYNFDTVSRAIESEAKGSSDKKKKLHDVAREYMEDKAASNTPFDDKEVIKHLKTVDLGSFVSMEEKQKVVFDIYGKEEMANLVGLGAKSNPPRTEEQVYDEVYNIYMKAEEKRKKKESK